MRTYRAGTLTLVANSDVITGVGTAFVANVSAGDIICCENSQVFEVVAVPDDTHLKVDAVAKGAGSFKYAALRFVTAVNFRDLSIKIEQFLADRQFSLSEFSDWVTGSRTGGPNKDGRYPLTDRYGVTKLFMSPELIAYGYQDSLNQAAAAAASATAAKTSETNANSSKTAAATSATNAKTSETNSKTSETNSKASETAAAASKTAAATSETNAAASQTAAATSATNAKTSETNANSSKNAAGTSATNAKTSETNSKTSETNAAGSASAAATSETNAKTSETNAKTSETAANGSKNAAATSATNAATSATNAGNSATAASGSATAAKTSETNAKTSENNAKASADRAAALVTDADVTTKAPKESPVFTGDPRAPTQADGDNDTSLANTAFVQRAMALFGLGVTIGIDVADLDAITQSGLYRGQGTAANSPFPNASISIIHNSFNATGALQLVASCSNNVPNSRFFWRTRAAGNWSPWQQAASLDSPSFTGTPTAPLAGINTQGSQIANLDFVRAWGRKFTSVGIGLSQAAHTLTTAQVTGQWLNITAANAVITLPAANTVNDGTTFVARNAAGANSVSLTCTSTIITDVSGTTLILSPYETIELVSSGNVWWAVNRGRSGKSALASDIVTPRSFSGVTTNINNAATYTVTAANLGYALRLTGTTLSAITLPDASAITNGSTVLVRAENSKGFTIQVPAGRIYRAYADFVDSNVTMAFSSNEWIELLAVGTDWVVTERGLLSPSAPTASPTFTGDVTMPTRPTADRSPNGATTQWVANILASYGIGTSDIQDLATGYDINTLNVGGAYQVNGVSPTVDGYNSGILNVVGANANNYVHQMFLPQGTNKCYHRCSTGMTSGSINWTSWTEFATKDDVIPYGLGQMPNNYITDLDDFSQGNGWYSVGSASGGTKPVGFAFGVLMVNSRVRTAATSRVVQMLFDTDNGNQKIYWRRGYSGVWGGWKEVASIDDVAAVTAALNNTGWGLNGAQHSVFTALGADVNLNTVMVSGTYGQSQNARASTALNYPNAKAGSLLVQNGGTAITTQLYIEYDSGKCYTRSRYNSNWSGWQDGVTSAQADQLVASLNANIANSVNAAKRNYSGNVVGISADVTLTTAQSGLMFNVTTAGVTITIPGGSSAGSGATYNFRNVTNGDITIKPASGSIFFSNATTVSFTLRAGEWVELAASTSNYFVNSRGILGTAAGVESPNFNNEVTITGINVQRYINGGSTAPAVIHRIDSGAYYMLLTNPSDQLGGFNSLRPFTLNLTTGMLSFSNGATVVAPSIGDRSMRIPTTAWVGSELNAKEDSIGAGSTSQFWRGDKTWQDFGGMTRGQSLAGLNVGLSGTLGSGDNIINAFGKVQAQFNAIVGDNSNIETLRARRYLDPLLVANVTGTFTLSLDLRSTFELTLTGNTTLAFSGSVSIPANAMMLTVLVTIKQGATARTLTMPANTKFITAGGAAIPTPGANKQQDYIFTTKDGTNWEVRAGAAT